MVDSTRGIGPVPGISAPSKPQSPKTRTVDEAAQKEEARRDEIVVSQKALNPKQAEEAARKVRFSLEQGGESLGLNPAFDQTV